MSQSVVALPEGVRLNPVPPTGFDPRTASDLALVHYGLPRRPDAAQLPTQARLWDELFARELSYVTPEFTPMARLVPGATRLPQDARTPGDDANATSSNWSGAVCTSSGGDNFKSIYGQWIVDDVAPPAAGQGAWGLVSWVGIDGWGSGDVCQVGTFQYVTQDSGGTVSKTVYAWTEWFPRSWVAITNFPVSFGDTLGCLLCVNAPTQAGFNLLNLTTGLHTGFTFNAPSGTTIVGNSAEWIVETPGLNGTQASLPEYGVTYFDGAVASTVGNKAADAGNGTMIDLVVGGTKYSTAQAENATLIKVSFV